MGKVLKNIHFLSAFKQFYEKCSVSRIRLILTQNLHSASYGTLA